MRGIFFAQKNFYPKPLSFAIQMYGKWGVFFCSKKYYPRPWSFAFFIVKIMSFPLFSAIIPPCYLYICIIFANGNDKIVCIRNKFRLQSPEQRLFHLRSCSRSIIRKDYKLCSPEHQRSARNFHYPRLLATLPSVIRYIEHENHFYIKLLLT